MMDSKRLILGLVVCAVGMGLAVDLPQTNMNAVYTNAMEMVSLDCTNDVKGLNYFNTLKSINGGVPRKFIYYR
jgi:hypothetical protein